jgi:hypothetical protein
MIKIRHLGYLLVLSLLCCKKPYNAPVKSSVDSFLVVEGTINSGTDSTIINISKTVKLTDTTSTKNPLLGATVTVESDQNGIWNLYDNTRNGSYGAAPLNLPAGQKYRLRITSADGRKYLSDFIAVKPTPPIDSVGYIQQKDGIQLYVNAHDPSNNTRYYRWDYNETWYFHSKWASAYVLDSATNTIVARRRDQDVHFCYTGDYSSHIVLNSTARLSSDVVYQSPIIFIPNTSEKIEEKYSILVKQYALPVEAYQFYQNLAKNTEQLGSIFDAQPTQLIGNIHCLTNPLEPVIGYLTVTNVQSKRIFIPTTDLTTTVLQTVYPYDCEMDTAAYGTHNGRSIEEVLLGFPIRNIPISAVGSNLPPTTYVYSSAICVDCTLRGTKKAPPFWK